jgi:hypothetical protein
MSIKAKLSAALVVVLGLVASHWYAYQAGNRNGQNAVLVKTQGDELMRKDIELSELAQANMENEAKALGFAAAAKEASKDHAKELQAVRAAADRAAGQRVQVDPRLFCGRQTGAGEATTPGSDGQGTPAAAFLPEWFASELRQAAAKADEITADMRDLKRRAEEAGCFQ